MSVNRQCTAKVEISFPVSPLLSRSVRYSPGLSVTLPGPSVTLPGPTVTLPGLTVERGSVTVGKAFPNVTIV